MAWVGVRVLSTGHFKVPVGVTMLVRAYSYMDFTSGNFWGVGRGPGIVNNGISDPSALVTIDNPGTTVANGGSTHPVAAEIGVPVLAGQSIYCSGDSATFLIFE